MNVLVLKAWLGLLLFDVFIVIRKFEALYKFLRERRVATAIYVPLDEVEKICSAIDLACVLYLKRVLCLQRSSVTVCLLRDAGFPAEMVFGAQAIPFKAHAWVELNVRVINERSDVRKTYAVWARG